MTVPFMPAAIDAVVKASLILGVTALAAASLRRASASARHLVWMLGLVSALAVPALGIVTPKWELPLVKVTAAAELLEQHHNGGTQARSSLGPVGSKGKAISAGPSVGVTSDVLPPSSPAPRTPLSPSPVNIVLTIWALGAAIVIARMLLGLVAVQWMSRRTAVVNDAPWLDEARSLAASLDLRDVRFLRSHAQSMPMAWGVFRSSVLMPADADGWPIERLRLVLLHELAHVKRHDCFTHLVAQLACAAYWFNPLAWMAARRVRTERERACDDLVLASGTRGSDYADQLLDIARVMRAGRFPAVLAGATLAMAHRSQLEGRLMAILDPNVQRRSLTRVGVLAAVGLFAILIVPVAAVQPWTMTNEPAAVKGPIDPIPQQQIDRPIESYPGQAAADNRANAAQQNVIHDDLQGRIQGAVQGGIAGGINGGIAHGIAEGVRGGVRGGVEGSIRTHVGTGIGAGVGTGVGIGVDVATGVTQTIVNGMANGIANGVVRNLPELAEAAGPHQRQTDPRAVNALVEALKDTDQDVRETAMQALVALRDPHIFEPLVMALHDSSADIREKAAFGLGQLRDARAITPLATAVKDQNADVREQAVFALGQLRAAEAIDAITPALHDSSDSVREQAAFALGQIRDPRAVEPLISALKDPKPDIRQQAAFALGQIRSPRAVDALVIALKDGETDVREQAAFALGQIRDPRAIDGLTAALKDASASVRQQAAFALGQIR